MVTQNKLLISSSQWLIKGQYVTETHVNKELVDADSK